MPLPCKSTPSSTSLSVLLPTPSVLESSLFSFFEPWLSLADPVSTGSETVEGVEMPDSPSERGADCSSVVSEGVGVDVVCTVSWFNSDSFNSSSAAYKLESLITHTQSKKKRPSVGMKKCKISVIHQGHYTGTLTESTGEMCLIQQQGFH